MRASAAAARPCALPRRRPHTYPALCAIASTAGPHRGMPRGQVMCVKKGQGIAKPTGSKHLQLSYPTPIHMHAFCM